MTKLDDSIIAYSLVNAESCHGTTVIKDNGKSIIDRRGRTWKIDSYETITVNEYSEEDYDWGGDWDHFCVWTDSSEEYCTVSLLLYWNQTVYRQNSDCSPEWCKWTNKRWVTTTDPRPTPTSNVASGCTLPSSTGRYESLSQKIIFYTVNRCHCLAFLPRHKTFCL